MTNQWIQAQPMRNDGRACIHTKKQDHEKLFNHILWRIMLPAFCCSMYLPGRIPSGDRCAKIHQ